jgi:hypothetical protein
MLYRVIQLKLSKIIMKKYYCMLACHFPCIAEGLAPGIIASAGGYEVQLFCEIPRMDILSAYIRVCASDINKQETFTN